MNVALRHGVTDLATIKRAYNSLGDGNVMAGGGPVKTKEPPFSLAQRAAENRARKAHLFDDGGDVGDDFESRLAKINAADAVKMRTMRNIEALYDSSLPDAYSARELIKDKDSGNMYYPSELFLLDPDKQLTMMEGLGFIPGEPHDYGTVAAKVARSSNPDMPVYQRYPHDITRDEITPIGRGYRGETFDNVNRPRTFQVDNGWLIGPDGHPVYLDDPKVNSAITKTLGADDWTDTKGLIDAGDYPFVLYRDDSGNFYVNAWDVNNYSDPMSPRFQNYNWWQKEGAKMLDRMGNPFVQTLGYKSLPLDDYGYAERGSGYILPNVTVTPKKKAHGGRLNLFDDGGQEDVIDWGNVDLKAMRDAYQQSQEDNVRTYTAVPASRMSYNERLRLWRNDDTGKWYPQDALIFPGGKLDGVTVVHNRNTNRDFVVPSDEYVRPLNTQDYFDHTGSNALEFASLMTSPTNLFMPSHVAGAIWDTRDKLSGKNPDVNLWDSWLHENRGIGRTGNPYLDAGLNLAGDVLGYSLPGALKSAGRATTNAVKRNFAKHMFMERAPFGYTGMVQAMKDIPRSMIHDAVRLHNPNYEEMLRRRKWYMDPQLQTAVDPYDVPLKKAMDARSDAYSMWLGLGPGNNTYVPHPTIPGVYYSPGDIATMPINMWNYMYGIAPLGKDFKTLFGRAFKDPFELLDGKPHHGIDNVNSSLGNLTVSFEPVGDKVVDEIGGKTNRYIMKQVDSWDVQPFIRATDHPSHRIERYLNKKGSPLAGTIKNPFANVGKPLIDLSRTISHATRPLAKTHPELRRRIRRVNDKLRENGVRLNSTLDPNTWKRKTYNWLDNKFNDFELSVLTGGSPFNVVNEVPMMVYLPKHGPAEYMRGWLHAAQTPESLPEELQTFMREHPYMDFDVIPRSYREMGYAHGGRLNKFDGLDNLDRPNQLTTAFDDLVAARDRYAQTGDIGTSWEPVDLNDVSITDNGFITREGRTGNSFVLPEAYVYGSRPATPEQSMVARRNDGQESESLLDKLVDAAGSAVAPFLTQLVGTAAAATPSKPFVVNKKQVAGQANEPAKEALHTVKSGENLSTIARNYGVDIGDIISSNGIANPDFIKPGQQLRIPGAGNKTMHTVKSGENLSSIAKKYGVSVDRIASINGIANPDFIKPGQELRIPNVNNDTSRTLWTPKQIKEEEARINAGGNVAIIHNYHSNKGKGKVYVIDDKLHNKVHVCKDGKVIKSYNGIHSWNASEDDAMTTTYVDKHGNIRDKAGNGMTPSGVFFLSRTNNYHGAPAFMRRTQEQVRNGSKKGVPNSIHLRTMKENAVTNGCTGMDAASLRDFASRVPDGTPCYILPANSDNKFFIRNGELQFHSSDTSKVPAYNVKTSTPIERITAKANGLSDTQRSVINGFSKGLIRHKSQLQRELGLNDDTYDRLALLALGILGRESNFGEEHSAIGNLARAVTKKLNHDTSSPDYKSKYATYGANSDNNSIGLTQLRIAGLSDKERELFERFGITKDSLVYEPELAAIATMIKLGYDYVNTGQNFDNTIAHWNGNRKGYVDQVKDIIDRRFEIYKKYGNK